MTPVAERTLACLIATLNTTPTKQELVSEHKSNLPHLHPPNQAYSPQTFTMTPRKPKQRQQSHRPTPSLVLASDYDSDILTTAHIHTLPPPTRTNTELNLSVLRRHDPSILTILSIAANAVIYTFTPATQAWEKSGVEGTLFVCETSAPPSSSNSDAGYTVVVLNRRGLQNLMLDLAGVRDVEVTEELLIIRVGEDGVDGQGPGAGPEEQKVMGVWIHEDRDGTRSVNAGLIQQCWEKVATATKLPESGDAVEKNGFVAGGSGAMVENGNAVGRRISLSDLFGQQGT